MVFFSKAKDNYDKRKDIAEYNYKAREYISDGQRMYQEAYGDLQYACVMVGCKVNDYVNYKQKILNEINCTLKKLDSDNRDFQLSTKVDFIDLEACAVRQREQLDCVDKALATWVLPSISDLFGNVSTEEYYMAKQNMYQAKAYKETMRTKRDELKNAKYAVKKIPDFISDEKRQIEELMVKFRKTAEGIDKSDSAERSNSLCQIARLIADLLATQFIDNNYQITSQYTQIHNKISNINTSLSNASWLIG